MQIDGFNELKASEKIDYFAYYLSVIKNKDIFTAPQIDDAFSFLRIVWYQNIHRYLLENSDKWKKKKWIKFLKRNFWYHLESWFEEKLKATIKNIKDSSFINYKLDEELLEWKTSDIPYVNSKIKKNAHFFTRLYFLFYHLENSIRKFLIIRLSSILWVGWETAILEKVDLKKAQSLKKEASLSEMISERWDNILYYCMWDDYSEIIKVFPSVFKNKKECDEIVAHLNSIAKVRNAIAHNVDTIPQEYQDELTLFLKKYIKILANSKL